MTSFARYHPFYVSMSIRNNGLKQTATVPGTYSVQESADNFIEARAVTQFNAPICDKASDFLVAIERMEIATNGIPFYDADVTPRETITVKSRDTNDTFETDPLTQNCYSLSHLLEYLNTITFTNPDTLNTFLCVFSVTKDGFVVCTLGGGETFEHIELQFPRRLNLILGLSTNEQINRPANVECESSFPRIDLGDDLDHIVLQTNLPTNTDALGNVKLAVLTDFSAPTAYSNSLAYGTNGSLIRNGFSTNIRQRIIYTPNERRYLELLGDFPIQDIRIEAYYINLDDTIKIVPLPLGASFEVKLGFYLKQ